MDSRGSEMCIAGNMGAYINDGFKAGFSMRFSKDEHFLLVGSCAVTHFFTVS